VANHKGPPTTGMNTPMSPAIPKRSVPSPYQFKFSGVRRNPRTHLQFTRGSRSGGIGFQVKGFIGVELGIGVEVGVGIEVSVAIGADAGVG
jgi:hypothetical protein